MVITGSRNRLSVRRQPEEAVSLDDVDLVRSSELATSAFKSRIDQFKHETSEEVSTRATRQDLPRLTSVLQSRKCELTDAQIDSRLATTANRVTKRRKQPSKYAPPSKYAHLPELTDVLAPGLVCIFVGTNPGIRTATAGHAYAHPSNLFWKLLHSSGCTDERLQPSQDVDLPRLYGMGNTNIVARPSRDAAELSKAEMAAGTPILEEKVAKYRPEAVCIVGKGIWEAIWRWRHKREIKKDEFKYGWQDDEDRLGRTGDWRGAPVFVATSTSGLSASTRPHEKEAIWRPFGEWVKQRRQERCEERGSDVSLHG